MKRILVVEDDVAILESVVEILRFSGYDVTAAQTGQDAIDMADHTPPFDLILLDLMMPKKNGFEFRQEQIKHKTWSQTPVVVMSADGHITRKQAEISAVAYLKKPFELDEFIEVVRQHAGT